MTHPQPEPPPFPVTPQPGDWLDDLLARYEDAKARAQEAQEYLDGLSAKLKSELTSRVPQGTRVIQINWRQGRTLTWVAQRRFDSKQFAREHPDIYEAYRKYGNGYWSW